MNTKWIATMVLAGQALLMTNAAQAQQFEEESAQQYAYYNRGGGYNRSRTVDCQSFNYQTQNCETGFNYVYSVDLVDQYSSASCSGKYGSNGSIIWVTGGCRGRFVVHGQ